MRRSGLHLTAAEAARELGVSAKALRLYEQNGLLTPLRTAAGWRIYGPSELARAREVAALRRLGVALAGLAQRFVMKSASMPTHFIYSRKLLFFPFRILSFAQSGRRFVRAQALTKSSHFGSSIRNDESGMMWSTCQAP